MEPLLRYTKKLKHATSHVFAETTRIIAAPYGFKCRGYSKFHRNPLRAVGVTGSRNLAIPITLAIGFTTACTTVQAATTVKIAVLQ